MIGKETDMIGKETEKNIQITSFSWNHVPTQSGEVCLNRLIL